MQQKDIALVKGLIQAMWADGEVAESERVLLGRLLVQLGCTPEEIAEVGAMMMAPQSIEDLVQGITDPALKLELIQLVVAVTLSDGEIAHAETGFIHRLAGHLGISDAQVNQIIAQISGMMEGAR